MSTQSSPSDLLGPPSELDRAMAEALNRRLLGSYGSTMTSGNVAEELGITVVALRIRKSRFGDLPPPIPHLRECRWPTPRIAAWLCALGADQSQIAARVEATALPRRRGRRRLAVGPDTSRAAPRRLNGSEA